VREGIVHEPGDDANVGRVVFDLLRRREEGFGGWNGRATPFCEERRGKENETRRKSALRFGSSFYLSLLSCRARIQYEAKQLTSSQMQPNQRVRQQTLSRPQHTPPPTIRRQPFLLPSSTLHPRPPRRRPRDRRSLHRLYRFSNERRERKTVRVVGGGRRDEEVGR